MLELLAESILINKNLSVMKNKQLSYFILHVGKLYSKDGLPKSTQFSSMMANDNTSSESKDNINDHDSCMFI